MTDLNYANAAKFAEVIADAVSTTWEMPYGGFCREWFIDIRGEKIAVQDYQNDEPSHCYIVS
jgi:hypothetical protein